MIQDLVLKDTQREEWDLIRSRIKRRIMENLGVFPVEPIPSPARFEELDRYEAYGLTHIRLRYHVFGNEWDYGILVLPSDLKAGGAARAVLTIHGTNGTSGKYGMLNPDVKPNRAYGIELAKRGYITFSPDQFGFGEIMETEEGRRRFEDFYKSYPDWSLTGRRVLGHVRAADVLDALDFVIHDGYGSMGNSLGGQASFYLTGLDERIKASVVSTGISPHASNAYRLVHTPHPIHPYEAKSMEKNGKSPWELNEMLALCAPRAVLCIEPFNDPHNPYTAVTIDCVKSAHKVYALLDASKHLSLYLHGDGHDTVPTVRTMAYDWLDRFLK